MSLVDQPLPLREAGHSNDNMVEDDSSYTAALETKSEHTYASHQSYQDSIYEEFFEMEENQDVMAPSPKRTQTTPDAPALPEKSALRASRLLDNLGLKLGGSIEATSELGQATPHDVYLSSEEDASSSADDFSDYDYESSSESASPSSRSSHEVVARAVSVVFSGKPSIIDLSLRRRSISPSSSQARQRADTESSISPIERSSTPLSSTSSLHLPSRKNSMLTDVFAKKKPPFLNIDPFANASTYSLELSKEVDQEGSPIKAPKTPTQVLKGAIGLVRKRSRPLLTNLVGSQRRDSLVSPTSNPVESPERTASPFKQQLAVPQQTEQPPVSPPVTYNDIIKAAKKNLVMMPPQPASQPESPTMASSGSRRGILSGLAARRRSIKLTGKNA